MAECTTHYIFPIRVEAMESSTFRANTEGDTELEQNFFFQITPLNPAQMCPQVSRALEKRSELVARQKYPKMWELTDKLNSVEKVPQAVRENRRRRRGFLGLLNWLIGVFLLVNGWVGAQKLLILLLVGAAAFGVGAVSLWRYRRDLLCVFSFAACAVLCVSGLSNFHQLWGLLVLGAVHAAIGTGALLTRKQANITPYDRAAARLLRGKDDLDGTEGIRCSFSSPGMHIGLDKREEDMETVPFSEIELVLETEDLLLPVCDDSILILQKKDLLF